MASDGNTAPLFLSAPLAVFTVGVAGTFTVRAAGDPVLSAGALSPGLEFTDYGGGMAVIEGTPAPTTAGLDHLTITATNGIGTTEQQFTLAISGNTPPVFTSPSQASFPLNSAGSFTITAPGALQLTQSGVLPDGIQFTDQGGGTAVLSGTPAADAASGTSVLTFTATNTAGTGTQSFDLTIGPPQFFSTPHAGFTVGDFATFAVQASGDPVLRAGVLPPGLEFTDHGGGTAVIAGSPAPGTAGSHPLTVTATSAGGTTEQQLTLAVSGNTVPVFTNPGQGSFAPNSFTVTAPGALQLTLTGPLPDGIQFTDQGGGTAVLSGTPSADAASGIYTLTLTASNAAGTVSQSFELTII